MGTPGSNEPHLYFAYGSNMSAQQMAARCPGAESLGAAMLHDWELVFDRPSRRWGGYVADIVQRPGSATWGVLWRVTHEHLLALDGFEGVAVGAYRRILVPVVAEPGAATEAVAYSVCTPVTAGLPSPAYLGVMLAGAREHHLPAEYIRQLQAFAEA